ncbi:MAG: HNH endonuclease [Pelagibacterales bacterium]|nr:HNH endonuclease [Pelagibacterales bacterium]
MSKHLIKRKDVDFNLKDGWYCEVSLNKNPTGINVKPGDSIYIAQNGYAIYGKGVVNKVDNFKFHSLEELVHYALHKSNVKDNDYWISKFKDYSDKLPVLSIKGFEYNLINTECFEFAIPLEKRFLQQPVWYYLEDNFTLKIPSSSKNLTTHIPTKIRLEVYQKFKIVSNEHLIDIDHFVPRSIGGPGNIIENLIPISASINRKKSNHIPSKLLDLAKEFGFDKPKDFILSHDKFYADKESIQLAEKIVQKINTELNLEKIRLIYKKIRDFHFPYLEKVR